MRSTSLRLLRIKQASASSILQKRHKKKGKLQNNNKNVTNAGARTRANPAASEMTFDLWEGLMVTSTEWIFSLKTAYRQSHKRQHHTMYVQWKWNCLLHMINRAERVQNAKQVWEDLKWCQMQDVSSTHTQPLPLIAQNPAKCMQSTYITHFHQSCTYFGIRFSIPYDTTPGSKRCLFVFFYFILFFLPSYFTSLLFFLLQYIPQIWGWATHKRQIKKMNGQTEAERLLFPV